VQESLPTSAFKDGRIPYQPKSFSFNEFDVVEPTAQSVNLVSPEDWTYFLGGTHNMLPEDVKRNLKPDIFTSDAAPTDAVRYGKAYKFKTSYTKGTGRPTPYRSTTYPSVSLSTVRAARESFESNLTSELRGSAAEQALLRQDPRIYDPTGTLTSMGERGKDIAKRVFTPENAAAMTRLIGKAIASGGNLSSLRRDPDFAKVAGSVASGKNVVDGIKAYMEKTYLGGQEMQDWPMVEKTIETLVDMMREGVTGTAP
jgi:hypothetical protein